ncbi:Cation efflux family protein [Shimia sp. SK013]|uniref:cation transporter n=1 Tax=Shimia sp. SK013 TaxID=1389006 RepID=UPI0006B63297|nr:cation transporter [Shimia sp. SK013]KPA20057.1 Cation efflux family protein [Shimia sp. SK013]
MDSTTVKKLESRSMTLAMAGSLFMGAAGVLAAILSNSTAILMDGMFSIIALVSALIGRKIGQNAGAAPDRFRPLGYAADEAVFVTFRSLSLIGLILFAAGSAAMNIYNYLNGAPIAQLNYEPMLAYFIVVSVTCFALWRVHKRTWAKTGKVSEILNLESKAAFIDGALTVGTAIGLGIIYFFGDGVLAPIAPIGDSIVVFALCLLAVGQVWRDLGSGMGELLGVTAKPEIYAKVRRALRPSTANLSGAVLDVSVVKLGRTYTVSVYYNPQQPIAAEEVDRLNLEMLANVRAILPGADVLLCISQYARSWPEGLVPD